jgi:hypothetical protein
MSKDRISLDQLIRIAEDKTWEDFEAMPDGRLLLHDHAQTILPEEEEVNPLLWVFEMRIGQHFERPMQAIMSCGHFIRMRSAESWGVAKLGKLDPAQPSNCLYAQLSPLSWGWRPYIPVVQPGGFGYGTLLPAASQLLGNQYQNAQNAQNVQNVQNVQNTYQGGLWSQIYSTITGNITP